MRGVDRLLLISSYIAVAAKTWRFHSWIETELYFSNNSLNDDFLSLHIVLRHEAGLSMDKLMDSN